MSKNERGGVEAGGQISDAVWFRDGNKEKETGDRDEDVEVLFGLKQDGEAQEGEDESSSTMDRCSGGRARPSGLERT